MKPNQEVMAVALKRVQDGILLDLAAPVLAQAAGPTLSDWHRIEMLLHIARDMDQEYLQKWFDHPKQYTIMDVVRRADTLVKESEALSKRIRRLDRRELK